MEKVQARYMTRYKPQRESSNSRAQESLCKNKPQAPKAKNATKAAAQRKRTACIPAVGGSVMSCLVARLNRWAYWVKAVVPRMYPVPQLTNSIQGLACLVFTAPSTKRLAGKPAIEQQAVRVHGIRNRKSRCSKPERRLLTKHKKEK